MTWSLGELQALCIKATRGSGCCWGMADEAGWAVRWLSAAGLPGAEALAAWLRDRDGACPICVGTAVADAQSTDHLGPSPMGQPLLVLPFLSRLAKGGALKVSMGAGHATVWATGASVDGALSAVSSVSINEVTHFGTIERHARVTVDAKAIAILQDFAARTYAPATDASREKGAGAGLTDND